MDRSKFLLACMSVLLLISSCAPMPLLYEVEVKKDTPIGTKLELDTKNIVICAIVGDSIKRSDSTLIAYATKGMAEKLEDNFGLESGTIPVLSINRDLMDIGDLYSRIYLMESMEKNILIALDSLKLNSISYSPETYEVITTAGSFNVVSIDIDAVTNIEVYNNLNSQPLFSNKDSIFMKIEAPGRYIDMIINDRQRLSNYLLSAFISYGKKIAESLSFSWEKESRIIYINDSYNTWYTAYDYIVDFEVEKAMNIWLRYVNHKNPKVSSAAAYNMSVACEISENYELALKWLDMSDKIYYQKEASVAMRKILDRKINAEIE